MLVDATRGCQRSKREPLTPVTAAPRNRLKFGSLCAKTFFAVNMAFRIRMGMVMCLRMRMREDGLDDDEGDVGGDDGDD